MKPFVARSDRSRFAVTAALCAAVSLGAAGCGGDPAADWLILISADTLRADRLGVGGGDSGASPNLDAFAGESQHFRTTYAPTSFTLPSVSAMLTGRYPEELGISGNRSALPESIPTLASELQRQGWRTAAVVSNFVLRRNSGLARGFDHYDDALPQHEPGRRGWPERTAESTSDAAIALIDAWRAEPRERSFLWVHYQDPHGPYTPPAGFRERFWPAEREAPDGRRVLPDRSGAAGHGRLPTYQRIGDQREVAFYRAGYAGEIAYLDQQVGRLLRAIDERGLRDRSVVVFTADHGEALGENDYWFAHGDHLIDPLVRVPLMIRVPKLEPEVRDDIVSLTDLYPTLLRLATGRAADARGRDLMLPLVDRRDSQPYLATLDGGRARRIGIVDGAFKLILTQTGATWEPQLYRRSDSGEQPSERAEVRDRLRAELDAFRNHLPRGRPELRQQLSADEEDQLRALGYLESEAPDPDPE